MSINKGVAAAQRRRQIQQPPQQQMQPPPQQRGPQSSINSAQMFASQSQGQMQSQQGRSNDDISGISKMTIPQAITLITLRLGQVETKLGQILKTQMEHGIDQAIGEYGNPEDGFGSNKAMDGELMHSIIQRLDLLESRSSSDATDASVSVLKQQMDTVKGAMTQTKVAVNSLIKDAKSSKTTIDALTKTVSSDTAEIRALIDDLNKQMSALSSTDMAMYDEDESSVVAEQEQKTSVVETENATPDETLIDATSCDDVSPDDDTMQADE